jgi:hypothetical protein
MERERSKGSRPWIGLVAVMGMAAASTACGHGMQNGPPKQPTGTLTVSRLQNPEDAPEEAKTIQVEYAFNKDLVNKDFEKTFKDGFDKSGVKVDETVVARSHFDVKDAKITGTVTYVKKGFGHYSIIEADLVASGHYDADVQIDVDVQAKGDTKKSKDAFGNTILGGKPIPLVKNVMPTNIPIAGPLFLHAHFDLSAACEMGVEGAMHATTGVGISGDVRLAARYKKAGFEKADGKKQKFKFEAKTPNFELAPKPYLRVEGKQQALKGKCSLQPTAVLLMEKTIGAKLSVEPYVEVEAKRPSTKAKWQVDAQAGVSVNAATDIEIFGRQIGKPKEFTLFEIALTKKGDSLSAPPPSRPAGVPEPLDTTPADAAVASAAQAPDPKGSTSEPAAPSSPSTSPAAPASTATPSGTSDATASAAPAPSGAEPATPPGDPSPPASSKDDGSKPAVAGVLNDALGKDNPADGDKPSPGKLLPGKRPAPVGRKPGLPLKLKKKK